MGVILEAIKLNHDPTTASHDALNLRRDRTTFIDVPEWRRGVSVSPEDAPAAYSVQDAGGNELTIQAQFSATPVGPRSVEIRAVDPVVDPPGEDGCLGFLRRLIAQFVRAVAGNILGEVAPQTVQLPHTGLTPFITFRLVNGRLRNAAVGVRTTTWRWQYRAIESSTWIDFATSNHRIYVVLAMPTAPWQQQPYDLSNTQLPWAMALDKACNWAVLKSDPVAAAGAITLAINDLGPSRLAYDCPGGGVTHYGGDISALLDRIAGGPGRGQYVNCSDCATFVSTFANLVGCDLWQSEMGWGFMLNPGLAIGSSTWEPTFITGFSYHEVAWTGGCDRPDHVYDACLKLDADADPTSPPHSAFQPIDLTFGSPGSGEYLDRLVPPASRNACVPQPDTRRRRMVY
jgi:hypothetical protein